MVMKMGKKIESLMKVRWGYLDEFFGGGEDAQAEGQEDPSSVVAVLVVVPLQLFADLAVDLIPEENMEQQKRWKNSQPKTSYGGGKTGAVRHLRSRRTMAYPTMMWSFSRAVIGRSSEVESTAIISLDRATLLSDCRGRSGVRG